VQPTTLSIGTNQQVTAFISDKSDNVHTCNIVANVIKNPQLSADAAVGACLEPSHLQIPSFVLLVGLASHNRYTLACTLLCLAAACSETRSSGHPLANR